MKTIVILGVTIFLAGCTIPNWPGAGQGSYGYGYPAYGYGYPMNGGYGGYPGYGGYGNGWNGYSYGYNNARSEDWRRWQAYQYGLSQGQGGGQANQAPHSMPYGITQNPDGRYNVPGRGSFTPGQIQHWARKHRR